MNYGKYSINQKQKDFASRKIMKKRKIAVRCFKAFLLILILACVAVASSIFVFAKSILDSTPEITPDDVSPVGYTSFIVDENGTQIESLLEAGSNRIYVELGNIPQDLQDAFVAIEDSRFYDHNGIDIIGILRAAMVGVTSGDLSEGASTITQQLIKNSIFVDFMSEETLYDQVERKIQEIYLALELEEQISKETILEDYLNTINLGQNTLGVQSAANRYFGKDVSELTLSECAVIAGITKNPTGYNPITYPDSNAERREKVLDDMLSQGYITQDEYDEAMADTEDVYARIQSYNAIYTESNSSYSYFTDLTISAVISDLQTELEYTYEQAVTTVYSGGITIVSTQDLELQEIVDTEFNDDENFPSDVAWNLTYAITILREDGTTENYWTTHFSNWSTEYYGREDPLFYENYDDIEPDIELYKESLNITDEDTVYENLDIVAQPQASFVIIDQSTGEVKALTGGRGEKTSSLSFNRADEPRQAGSTFKVVSTYAPALDLGIISLASVIVDEEIQYVTGETVTNSNNKYVGAVTVRYAIYKSINTVAVKTYYELTFDVAWEYLMDFGFTTLVHPDENIYYNDYGAATALGGLTNGATVLEMTAAYAAIANGGVYIEPTLYTQILDSDGNVLLENVPETRTVIQESTAALVTEALQDVVTLGTGTKASIGSQTVAGKTGTTTGTVDLWFIGYSPYYTAGIWYGVDQPYDMSTLGWNSGYHTTLWSTIMSQVHEDLPVVDFELPDSVQKYTVCKDSGLLAVTDKTVLVSEMEDVEEILASLAEGTYATPLTGTVTCDRTTEYFADGTQPTEYCDCTASGHTITITQSAVDTTTGTTTDTTTGTTTDTTTGTTTDTTTSTVIDPDAVTTTE